MTWDVLGEELYSAVNGDHTSKQEHYHVYDNWLQSGGTWTWTHGLLISTGEDNLWTLTCP